MDEVACAGTRKTAAAIAAAARADRTVRLIELLRVVGVDVSDTRRAALRFSLLRLEMSDHPELDVRVDRAPGPVANAFLERHRELGALALLEDLRVGGLAAAPDPEVVSPRVAPQVLHD